MDLTLFKKIMAEARNNKDLLDSVSPNQYKSKERLIKHVENLQLVDQNSDIVILGGWYGSILIPAFKYVNRIAHIDLDDNVIRIAKNRLFNHYKNVDFITADVFDLGKHFQRVEKSDLIINTSCEHMSSMKKLELNTKAYFAYQSNNMYDIEGHINCVSSIEEFKYQLPDNAKVMIEDKIIDERGTRFLLVGKYE
tara:strand:+ start:126 stop:710 length:585 start_codon:yes stop_codon:yes gene_type:complete